jgi:hypothetical protein
VYRRYAIVSEGDLGATLYTLGQLGAGTIFGTKSSPREGLAVRAVVKYYEILSGRGGGTGRRIGLKIRRSHKGRAGSIPAPGTNSVVDVRAIHRRSTAPQPRARPLGR